ncbi:MAG: CHASE2 domain-containing protein [Cytophagales bacterium]
MTVKNFIKSSLHFLFNWDSFVCSIFVFLMLWVFSNVEIPSTDLVDPVGKTFEDFDATDVVFSKIRKYKTKENEISINDEMADTNVVIVNIGECSRGEIGEMINIVSEFNPKVIGIDAFFKKLKNPEQDSILENALKNNPNIVMVSKLLYDDEEKLYDIETSNPMFAQHTQHAYANLITEGTEREQKTCRTFDPQEKFNDSTVVAFPVKLASYISPEKVKKFLDRNYEVEIINYLGNINISEGIKFTTIDNDQVLERQFDSSLFENKIVLFGFMGRKIGIVDLEDIFYTPLNDKYVGKSYPDMYGIVIHANIINMILSEKFVDVMPEWQSILFGILICYFTVAMLMFVFKKIPLLYGTVGKIIQLAVTFIILYFTIKVFYEDNYRLELSLAIITVLLAADLLEVYMEFVKNSYIKLRRLIAVKKKKN